MNAPELLLVDDDPGMIQVMAGALKGMGRIRFAMDGHQALAKVHEHVPDLVLLDGDLPDISGFEVCRRMKADPALADVPVIFVTGYLEPADELRGLEAGASDFITKPISEPLLVARVRTQLRVKALTDTLRAVAATDGLTGQANRRSFDEALQREWARANRTGQPLALLMMDVDHFKAYNDHYGHPAGDDCLRRVADAASDSLRRPTDVLARYGGEEFVVLLPNTDGSGAEDVAARIQSRLRDAALPHATSQTADHVTVSVGIAVYPPRSAGPAAPGLAPERLTQAADEALYAAKQAGRDRTWRQDILDAQPSPAAPGGCPLPSTDSPATRDAQGSAA
ncbi:diguanylate cyclase domain-containing protein [Roseateles sp. BYS87W]|uniref:diguanylate cyclase n=1 Tax=Pelomonas baiyunensis TaxID=3299026 RepID=A0ABW7GWP3_9BURK